MAAHRRLFVSSGLVLWAALSVLSGCGESSFTGSSSARKDTKTDKETETQQTADSTPDAPVTPELGTSSPAQDKSDAASRGTPEAAVTPEVTTKPATIPQGAVTKGSFTVWAEPAHPASYQDYQIFIKVDLPSGTAQYQQSDIAGTLVGTDGYDQSLAESIKTKSYQPEKPDFTFGGQTAQISLWVPGTFSKVQDTVQVRSTLLGESQNITIVFQ